MKSSARPEVGKGTEGTFHIRSDMSRSNRKNLIYKSNCQETLRSFPAQRPERTLQSGGVHDCRAQMLDQDGEVCKRCKRELI